MDYDTLLQLLASMVRLGVPLLLACLAGLYSERSGIFDIGLEGKMLVGAFLAGAIAYTSGSAWVGLLAAIGISVLFGLIHGVASITFRGNQLISGVAINFLASGLTVLVGQTWFGLGGRTPALENSARFEPITLPFADALSGVPVLGPLYAELISGQTILAYTAFAARRCTGAWKRWASSPDPCGRVQGVVWLCGRVQQLTWPPRMTECVGWISAAHPPALLSAARWMRCAYPPYQLIHAFSSPAKRGKMRRAE